jgi:hypothetical protein
MMDFDVGDRVRISLRYHWAKGASGTIEIPPEFAQDLVADQDPWDGHCRFVRGRSGPIKFYWVEFDEPQMDADGDGPYSAGEIDADMLEPESE